MEVAGDRRRHRHQEASEFLSLGVRPTRRPGQAEGVSRRQVAHTMMEAVSPHLPRPLTALVDESNEPARRMYDQMGWVVSDRLSAGWPVTQLVYRWDGEGISR
jgi:hypothetical protein